MWVTVVALSLDHQAAACTGEAGLTWLCPHPAVGTGSVCAPALGARRYIRSTHAALSCVRPASLVIVGEWLLP